MREPYIVNKRMQSYYIWLAIKHVVVHIHTQEGTRCIRRYAHNSTFPATHSTHGYTKNTKKNDIVNHVYTCLLLFMF